MKNNKPLSFRITEPAMLSFRQQTHFFVQKIRLTSFYFQVPLYRLYCVFKTIFYGCCIYANCSHGEISFMNPKQYQSDSTVTVHSFQLQTFLFPYRNRRQQVIKNDLFIFCTSSTRTSLFVHTDCERKDELPAVASSKHNVSDLDPDLKSPESTNNQSQRITTILTIPIFPLRKKVRLPTEYLYLNLYEQRYIDMVEYMHDNAREFYTIDTPQTIHQQLSSSRSPTSTAPLLFFGTVYSSNKPQLVVSDGSIVPLYQRNDVGVVFVVTDLIDEQQQNNRTATFSRTGTTSRSVTADAKRRIIRIVARGAYRFRILDIVQDGCGLDSIKYDYCNTKEQSLRDEINDIDKNEIELKSNRKRRQALMNQFIVATVELFTDETILEDDSGEDPEEQCLPSKENLACYYYRLVEQQRKKSICQKIHELCTRTKNQLLLLYSEQYPSALASAMIRNNNIASEATGPTMSSVVAISNQSDPKTITWNDFVDDIYKVYSLFEMNYTNDNQPRGELYQQNRSFFELESLYFLLASKVISPDDTEARLDTLTQTNRIERWLTLKNIIKGFST